MLDEGEKMYFRTPKSTPKKESSARSPNRRVDGDDGIQRTPKSFKSPASPDRFKKNDFRSLSVRPEEQHYSLSGAKFECKLKQISLKLNPNFREFDRYDLVFSFVTSSSQFPVYMFKIKSGSAELVGQDTDKFSVSKSWKMKNDNPDKMDMILQYFVYDDYGKSFELGYMKKNFMELATGPSKYDLDILSHSDLSVIIGVISFNFKIEETYKSTSLKLDLTAEPALQVDFNTSLYCSVIHIPKFRPLEDVLMQSTSRDNTVLTSKPLREMYSNTWKFKIKLSNTSLDKIRDGCLLIKLNLSTSKEKLFSLKSSKKSPPPSPSIKKSLSLAGCYTTIPLESTFPSGLSNRVEFRSMLIHPKSSKEKNFGNIYGVAQWVKLPLIAQMKNGYFNSKSGLVGGVVIKGAMSPKLPKKAILLSSLNELMISQHELHSNLKVPYFLHHLLRLIENDGYQTRKIFSGSCPLDYLREVLWEFDKGNIPHEIEPQDAALLVKCWLSNCKTPIIPHDVYYNLIKHTSSTKQELGKQLSALPEENLQVLFRILDVLCKIDRFKDYTETDLDTLSAEISQSLCRCPSKQESYITKYAKNELKFVKNLLINNWKTPSWTEVMSN
eukprot:TRINITY_DN4805_c0_g1_i4.p1 TRINITY_DN4805_c0_g1~~TRINITY_DN4805_c0_g1_i4.p1  ORF type:complete len:611 (+),score=118.29 TRINITY_DN4805_c0_g1_i4:882-2714(+)